MFHVYVVSRIFFAFNRVVYITTIKYFSFGISRILMKIGALLLVMWTSF